MLRISIPARIAEFLVGVVFLAGAVLKALDINLFAVQIYAYGVFDDKAWLPAVALGTLAVETLLGMALVLGLRFRTLSFAVLELLLFVFTCLILYGWICHDLADCGCFGALEMSPGVSIAKNAVLAALGALAWALFQRRPAPPHSVAATAWRLGLAVLVSAGLVAYAFADLERIAYDPEEPESPDMPSVSFSQFVFDTPQGSFDLGEGEYLVAVLSAGCDHCMEEAPALDQLAYMPDLPPLVGLCYVEEGASVEEYRLLTGAQFPIHDLDNQHLLYFNLIGDDSLRVYLVRDGRPVAFWDGRAPQYGEVLEALDGPFPEEEPAAATGPRPLQNYAPVPA